MIDRHRRIGAGGAKALRPAGVEQIVAIRLIVDSDFRRERFVGDLSRPFGARPVLRSVGEIDDREIRLGVARAGGEPELIGEREGDVGEAGDLLLDGGAVVDVAVLPVERIFKEVLQAHAEYFVEEIVAERIDQLFDAALLAVLVKQARDPGQPRTGTVRLQANLLREDILLVRDLRRAEIERKRRVDPGRGQEGIDRTAAVAQALVVETGRTACRYSR